MNSILKNLALWCVARGATPNMISCVGLLFSCLAAACLVAGAGHLPPWEEATSELPADFWPVAAGLSLAMAGLLDLFDGAVARNGQLQTRFGGVLDSTLDRFGDMVVFVACSLHFARIGNLTYVALSGAALMASVQISYIKARSEVFTDGMNVGFWQRGERMVAMILGGLLGRIPTVLWLLALLPMLTVLRRILQARRLLAGTNERMQDPGTGFVPPWQRPRRSASYRIVCLIVTVFIVTAPRLHPLFTASADPLARILQH